MTTVQDHAAALLGLLSSATGSPALTVFDGGAPDTATPPYVVAYIHISSPEQTGLTGVSDRVVARLVCHCVGGSDVAARAVSGRVRDAVLDRRPTVAGRVVFPVRHEDSVPPARDESTGRIYLDLVDTYRLDTLPA